MVYHPCQLAGTLSKAAYRIRMPIAGNSYQERQGGRIQCTECGEEIVLRFLAG